MARETVERLTGYLLNEAGDGLRTVVVIHEDGYDTHYLRHDLRGEYTEDRFSEVVETFRDTSPSEAPDIEGTPIGTRRAVVTYHENAFVLQFPVSDSDSVLISLTADAGRDLLDFIESCQQITRADADAPKTQQSAL
ncbi:hypothetical protein [Natronomonas sp. EA1]|uniref:hypothetical protein n=1 Tax=Natronomonas sp. EA1 TaxID=3421655 RepID=UPI003EC06684